MVQVREAQSGLGANRLDSRCKVQGEPTGLAEAVGGRRDQKRVLFKGSDVDVCIQEGKLMIVGGKYAKCNLEPSCTVYLGQGGDNFLARG